MTFPGPKGRVGHPDLTQNIGQIPAGRASPPPSPRGCTPWATAHRRRWPRRWQRCSPAAPDAVLSHRSAAALWRTVPRWPSPAEVTAPAKHRRARHPRRPLPQRRRHHPLRHPRHDPGPHARRPRRRPEPQTTHPSPQRGPGPTAHHPRRADHPPHPMSRPAHLTTHARAGRHPLHPRRRLRPLPQAPPPAIPGVQPNRLPATKSTPSIENTTSSSNSTAASSTPPPRAFENDRDRDADLVDAGFPTLRITDQRLKHHASQRGETARRPSCAIEAASSPGSSRAVACPAPPGSRATASRRAPPGGPRARAAPSRCRRPRRRPRRRRPRS